jgi:antitoxin component of MazEF toxin-antitoxin module
MASLKLIRKISESGRSLVLRIPRDVERALEWKDSDNVQIWIENGVMMVKKAES